MLNAIYEYMPYSSHVCIIVLLKYCVISSNYIPAVFVYYKLILLIFVLSPCGIGTMLYYTLKNRTYRPIAYAHLQQLTTLKEENACYNIQQQIILLLSIYTLSLIINLYYVSFVSLMNSRIASSCIQRIDICQSFK